MVYGIIPYGNGIMALTNDDGMIYDDGITDDGIWWYIMEYDIYIYNDLYGIGIMALYIYTVIPWCKYTMVYRLSIVFGDGKWMVYIYIYIWNWEMFIVGITDDGMI